MKRTISRLAVALTIVVALGILAVAQGSGQGDRRPPAAAQRPDQGDRRLDAGRAGQGTQATTGTVTAVLPPDQGARGVTRALAAGGRVLREWDDRVSSGERVRELRLRTRQADTLVPGRVHERLDQDLPGRAGVRGRGRAGIGRPGHRCR